MPPPSSSPPTSYAELTGLQSETVSSPSSSSPLQAQHFRPAAVAAATSSSSANPLDRVRASNPARRAGRDDDLRTAVTRDALREEMSPPASRAPPAAAAMQRTASIDSTASTFSAANSPSAHRVTQEPAAPQDVAALIAAAGSPDAAIQKLINEKNQATSHNAQLWRLVEKQRAMILGLNKDLEKSLKDKERYRRKLKDHLVQSASAPSLTAANQQLQDLVGREDSRSSPRDASLDSRKVSDASDAASSAPGRSDTPQDASNAASSALPATPRSSNSGNAAMREIERRENTNTQSPSWDRKVPAAAAVDRMNAQTPPMSPRTQRQQSQTSPSSAPGHKKNTSIASVTSDTPSAQSFSSPKNAQSRKAPPAPLDLKRDPRGANVTNNFIMDASDSEYEEDPDSARTEQMNRGRRKTREEDDRDREAVILEEMEDRSQSKGLSKSSSGKGMKSKQSADESARSLDAEATKDMIDEASPAQRARPANDSAATTKARAPTDTSGGLPKSATAPSLMSPGLPMSPRPGDRPMNSPMPRAPNKAVNSIPMSPKSGVAGLPLSPRAPRQPFPVPSQTPHSHASPHLARAEAYQQLHVNQPSSLANQVNSSPRGSPELERPSTSSEPAAITPGEIFRGYTTEQYPDLLLPPNALPSIYVKTASSRMRPSRMSYLANKNTEENPVFTLAVHERADNKQLWRVEKTFAALTQLDEQIKSVCAFRDRLPDKVLFTGHAPAKIDARRSALDGYFGRMLESIVDERAAMVVCKYLSTDAIGAADGRDYFARATGSVDLRPDTPVTKMRPRRDGYLTKRGKNFGGWKARFFVLDGPVLKYFDNLGGAQLGLIKLQNAQIGKQSNNGQNAQEDEDNQFRHAFLVLEPKKKDSASLVRHVLCAESDEERDAWVEDLLQYVDYRDDEDEVAPKAALSVKQEASGARSPRLKPASNDMRPPSRNREAAEPKPETIRAVGYGDTVAGDAPVIGPGPQAAQKTDSPSPPYDGNFANEQSPSSHPTISGPTNLQVISNTGDWGMKAPPTTPHGKDKKRSIFGFRGRSSSDLAPGEKTSSPGITPQDHYATGTPRAVFGVPLAEAVEFARPADVETDLPAVVYRCIEYLFAKNAIAEEGIFRLSGSNTVIKGLKDRFNTEGDINLTGDGKYYDIHAVASLLKLYLRELPSSILTRELHLEFLQCLEMHGNGKLVALNSLVHKLPRPHRALLDALSSFLLSIVNNAEVNKMNVRNVGIVFAPTLNVPAPLISSFVEDQSVIFGPPMDPPDSAPSPPREPSTPANDLRSSRKQVFSDLPSPAYNQTNLSTPSSQKGDDTGMTPMQPSYANYQMAPQGDGGYGSLNDALRSPTVYKTAANGAPSPRESKTKRRESSMLGFTLGSGGLQKKSSMNKMREEEPASF